MRLIEPTTYWVPPKKLIEEARKAPFFSANDALDFMVPADLYDLFPKDSAYEYSKNSAVFIRAKCISPHRDDPVGELQTKWSMFCVLGFMKPKADSSYLMVESESTPIMDNQYVVFRDDKLHCVTSNAEWFGFAVQVRKRRR